LSANIGLKLKISGVNKEKKLPELLIRFSNKEKKAKKVGDSKANHYLCVPKLK
jgi:hypothetical protein